jgi:hypothetical protein
MSQDLKAHATVLIGKDKIVICLPSEVCGPSVREAVCTKDNFRDRLLQLGITLPGIEPFLSDCFEVCDDFVGKPRLGRHSIELPFNRVVLQFQRNKAGETLSDALIDRFDYEVEIMPLNDMAAIQAAPVFAY